MSGEIALMTSEFMTFPLGLDEFRKTPVMKGWEVKMPSTPTEKTIRPHLYNLNVNFYLRGMSATKLNLLMDSRFR